MSNMLGVGHYFGVVCAVFGHQQAMSASTNAVQPVTIKTPDGAMAGTESYAVDPYSGKDAVANGGRLPAGDPSRRAFAYFMMGSARSLCVCVSVSVPVPVSVCLCLCLCAREKERERERESVSSVM